MHDDSASFWADIKEYEGRLARDPESYLFARLAEIYLKVGLVDDALHVARQGAARHPAYVAGQRVLARACHARGLKDECRAALERVTLALPEDGDAQRMLGRLLSGQGAVEAAARAFRTALEFNPDDMESRVELEALERAMAQSRPVVEETGVALGAAAPAGDHLDADFGAFEEEPEEIIEDAEILEVDEADLLESEEGAGEAAAAAVEPAAPAAPVGPAEPVLPGMVGYDPLSTVTLAELYIQQGFTDKALEVYRTILAHDPANAQARSRIAVIEGLIAAAGGLAPQGGSGGEPVLEASPTPAPEKADERIAILEGWLGTIGRLKACR